MFSVIKMLRDLRNRFLGNALNTIINLHRKFRKDPKYRNVLESYWPGWRPSGRQKSYIDDIQDIWNIL